MKTIIAVTKTITIVMITITTTTTKPSTLMMMLLKMKVTTITGIQEQTLVGSYLLNFPGQGLRIRAYRSLKIHHTN